MSETRLPPYNTSTVTPKFTARSFFSFSTHAPACSSNIFHRVFTLSRFFNGERSDKPLKWLGKTRHNSSANITTPKIKNKNLTRWLPPFFLVARRALRPSQTTNQLTPAPPRLSNLADTKTWGKNKTPTIRHSLLIILRLLLLTVLY